MKVFNTFESVIEERAGGPGQAKYEDPICKIRLQDYEEECGDFYLFVVGFGDKYAPIFDPKYSDKPRYVLNLEEPNFCTDLYGPHAKLATGIGFLPEDRQTEKITEDTPPDKVFTLCPYTAESIENREAVFFPFNPDHIPNSSTKDVDFVYAGSAPRCINLPVLANHINENKRSFAYVSWDAGNVRDAFTYDDKMSWYGRSRMSIIHCTASSVGHEPRYKNFYNASTNRAFDHLDIGIMPQIKSRVFESAFAKCIMLVKRDPWNVIERFFEPGKEFLYFNDEADFLQVSEKVLSDYDSYKFIAENAYEKAMGNYTTKHFVERYLK